MNVNLSKLKLNTAKTIFIIRTFSLPVLFLALSNIIAPQKGMDFSDEGHYLLSADPSKLSDAWGWPYGWNLHLLFRISGYSISNFRMYGFVLLLLATYRFSKKLCELLIENQNNRLNKFEQILFQILVTSSSVLFYSGFLRSPNYNWLNLVGMTLFLAGIFGLIIQLNESVSQKKQEWKCKTEMALGLFIALPAKPSTYGFGMISLFLCIFILKNLNRAIQISVQVTLIVVSFISLSLLTGFWPTTILNQIAQIIKMPPLAPNHSLTGAIQDLGTTPFKLIRAISLMPEIKIVILALFIALILNISKIKGFERYRIFAVIFWIVVITISFHFFEMRKINISTNSDFNWIENTLISKSLILLILIFSFYKPIKFPKIFQSKQKIIPISRISFLIYLSLLIALTALGFGSSVGILGKLTLGASFLMAILATQIVTKVDQRKSQQFYLVGLNLFTLFITVTVILGSYMNPYRSQSLSEMNHQTLIGNHNSTILLDRTTSFRISGMRQKASEEGFQKTTPVINLTYPAEVGAGYVLGGRLSPTIHFVMFGYPNSIQQAEYLFSKSAERFDFQNAWILKSTDSFYKKDILTFKRVMKDVGEQSKRKFPEKYILVYQDTIYELWKPSLA